ncbi:MULTISPECIES: LysR family transcriptional regulator [unclassified Methylobacterium]|uniref:LysR family transcriptional regulator n=1 Tax=unclassified Methylobacterium TaxID=2615210 RepID=UPI001FB99047|nr:MULTISPECIES: LysR family transcriptional regulator [unclassified Methylobacterium]MCJ2091120.1 LysR family transcriptional regulator [Methylobacterium sp. J-072]MCJ2141583.1 LysR family transcriptional regulator [Methylobacterium sp. E-066]
MDLRQLRYFVTVASERNFNRAAERLRIAQPPLSRSIQQLEAELRVTLIDRVSRPLTLTPIGQLFHDQAIQILRRVDDMRTMMNAAVAAERRRFTIGFVASTIYARLPALIREFRAEMPNVELSLVESGTLDQIAALKEGRIDVGFGRIRFEDPAVRRTVLRREMLAAAVPIGSPLGRGGDRVSLATLAQERLILYPSSPRPSYADQVLSVFHDAGVELGLIHEVRELQIAIGLVAAEEGIAIVPESVRQARTEDVRYVELAEPVSSPIIMSYRIGDISPEIASLKGIIARKYADWGYGVPEALRAVQSETGDA